MTEPNNKNHPTHIFNASHISKPNSVLLKYFFLLSLITGPGFPFVFLYLFFRYKTLRYAFDESGISMSWGILFRQEINLTYRRIQDIHLTRNIVQRWMGLATIDIQTASGNSGPEMSIEGLLDSEQLRDYLYAQMRDAKDKSSSLLPDQLNSTEDGDEVLTLLKEIRDLLKKRSDGSGVET